MSKTITIQNNILEHLKEKLDIPGLNFFKMFLPKEVAIVKEGEEKSNYPFLIIRPGKEVKNGVFKKRKFELLLGTEQTDDEKTQEEIFDIAEKIIETLEKNSLVPGKFTIDPTTIVGDFNAELCGEDFWGYVISFESDIPVPKSKILEERGF